MNNLKNNPVELVYSINTNVFTFINGNRQVKDVKHIDSIAAAMRRGDFIPPIIVDESTGTIIDGQHRYQAACNLWKKGIEYNLLVMYVDYPNPLLAAIKYNNNSKKWTTENYVNAYIADGNYSYVLLKKFCESHDLLRSITPSGTKNCYKAAFQILTGMSSSACISKGTLVITEDQYVKAEETYNQLKLITEVTGYSQIISRTNILAWLEVREFILSKMVLDKYCALLKKYFVCPNSEKREEWVKTYLEVASKAK